MKLFLKKLCENSSRLFMLEEIIKHTVFVLIFGLTNTIIRIIGIPFHYIISALIGIAKFSDDKGVHHCKELQELYSSLSKEEQND